MKLIHTRSELQALARELGVRPDWHEPDEQDVTAVVKGRTFDNAGLWPDARPEIAEKYVIIRQGGKDIAAANLATLFAWACGGVTS